MGKVQEKINKRKKHGANRPVRNPKMAIEYVLHDDCRECMKKVFDAQPIVKEIGSIADFNESTFHLYHTKNSLPYLLQMTIMGGNEIVRIFHESGNKELSQMIGDYFADIEQILRMVISMKEVADATKQSE